MNLKTAVAVAVAAAFAVPLAAQASADADKIILAQTPGKITTDPKDSNPAAPPATTGSGGRSGTMTDTPKAERDRPATGTTGATGATGAAGSTNAPMSSGTNSADRKPNTPKAEAGASGRFSTVDKNSDGYISRDEARDATWANRFSELDRDNDGRLSQSEFNAMQAAGGATTGTATAPMTSGTNSADRKPNTPKTEGK